MLLAGFFRKLSLHLSLLFLLHQRLSICGANFEGRLLSDSWECDCLHERQFKLIDWLNIRWWGLRPALAQSKLLRHCDLGGLGLAGCNLALKLSVSLLKIFLGHGFGDLRLECVLSAQRFFLLIDSAV